VQQTWRDKLISEHTNVARRIALKMARRCPTWIAREDLVAAGMLGLTEAARRYDDTRAEPFLSFAEQRIRGAVLDELRRGDLLPRRVRQLARKVATTIRALETTSGSAPSEEAIAGALGVTLESYRSDLAHLVHVDVQSLDGEGATQLADDQVPVDELAGRRQALAKVRAALDRLETRDVTLLGLHYLEELTFQEIATTLKITPSRACQLLWRAVERLRALLGTPVSDAA
jgi:RNA polymerase sigma factor for flagellar operon FliA